MKVVFILLNLLDSFAGNVMPFSFSLINEEKYGCQIKNITFVLFKDNEEYDRQYIGFVTESDSLITFESVISNPGSYTFQGTIFFQSDSY